MWNQGLREWPTARRPADPAHAADLADLRGRLEGRVAACRDAGPEPEAMDDSVAVYRAPERPEVERNIATMKAWWADGK